MTSIYWTLSHAAQVPLEEDIDFLSEAERRTLAALRFPKRRQEWLLGRWASKRLVQSIAPYREYPLAEIEIRNGPEGAPYIEAGEKELQACLSISHSDRFALCALAAGHDLRLGADLEKVEPRSQAFVGDYFTPAEQDLVAGFPTALKQTATNLVWSLKESMLKALGVGLHWDTRRVEVRRIEGLYPVSMEPGKWHSLEVADAQQPDRPWKAWWQCRRDYVLTLAGFLRGPAQPQSFHLVEKSI